MSKRAREVIQRFVSAGYLGLRIRGALLLAKYYCLQAPSAWLVSQPDWEAQLGPLSSLAMTKWSWPLRLRINLKSSLDSTKTSGGVATVIPFELTFD